ncbi:hypothetical protein [Micromonospora hortensis]|uniref:hypothetical protein n=1 Tax=Micromonospora hortensis TaxID=2911209 RepID=UPI001EE8071F|nr:hypothetical protein [Micromonospora hortensis]MCG5451534.1 hypothetical protein [Micromonospora hortensis]
MSWTTVGDVLLISAEALDARIVGTTPQHVLVDWPWWEPDLGSTHADQATGHSSEAADGLVRAADGLRCSSGACRRYLALK